MTYAQAAAINALLKWSTIPESTMAAACAFVDEAAKKFREEDQDFPERMKKDLTDLGEIITAIHDAFRDSPVASDSHFTG